MFNIYYLCREDEIPFYVGKAKNSRRRENHHRRTYGNDVNLIIIDEVEDWKWWECYWIEQFKYWGFKLTNKNNGGGGPSKYTEEQKAKMRKPRKKGTGAKISKTLLEGNHVQYYTKEVRAKMSKNLKGISRTFTQEHKDNIAKANLRTKGKTIECFDLDGNFMGEFRCLREAKNWLLIKKPTASINVDKQIKDCCVGNQKTCHGYKWRHKNKNK